jgi:tetratricopeptide (TPR) repeat protein
VAVSERSGDALLVAWAHLQLGATTFWRGDPATALPHLERAIAVHDPTATLRLRGAPDPGVAARAYAAWALWHLGYPDRALATSRESVTLGRRCGDRFSLSLALCFGCALHQLRREPEAVRAYADEVVALATAHGFPVWRGMGQLMLGWALAYSPGGENAIDVIREALGLLARVGTEVGATGGLAVLADAERALGRDAEALAAVEAGLAIAEQRDDHVSEPELHRLKGELLLRMGVEGAEQAFRRAVESARAQHSPMFELRAATAFARAPARAGRAGSARRGRQRDRASDGGLRHPRRPRRDGSRRRIGVRAVIAGGRRLRVGILELLRADARPDGPARAHRHLIARQYASITPQAVSVWCRQLGHATFYATYYGQADPAALLPADLDVVFIATYTSASPLAYALARLYRRRRTLTVVGGPHAKAFPDDCARFFDVVVGDCDRAVIAGGAARPPARRARHEQVAPDRRPLGRGAAPRDPGRGLLARAAASVRRRRHPRERRLPLPLRLLHRLGCRLPQCFRRNAVGPTACVGGAAAREGRVPRPEFRGSLRRRDRLTFERTRARR